MKLKSYVINRTAYTDKGSREELQMASGRWLLLPCPWHLVFFQISDFGLSRLMQQSTHMQYTERSALRVTLSYIPLETFLENSRAPGPEYDVYR